MLNGLILCGGKSKRLGFPKYQIEYKGVSLYKWWIEVLKPFCPEIFISCQSSQSKSIDFPNLILDEDEHAGPLEGIRKAFAINDQTGWLVVACDLVYISSSDILRLIQLNQLDADAISYKNPETMEPFPLCCIYNPSIKSNLLEEFKTSVKSPRRLLQNSNTILVETSHHNLLKGINTPDELRQWQLYLLTR